MWLETSGNNKLLSKKLAQGNRICNTSRYSSTFIQFMYLCLLASKQSIRHENYPDPELSPMLLNFFQIRRTALILLSLILVFVGDVGRAWCFESGRDSSPSEPIISNCSPAADRCSSSGFGVQSPDSVPSPSDCLECVDVAIGEFLQINSNKLVQDIPPLLPAALYCQGLLVGNLPTAASLTFLQDTSSSSPPPSAVLESIRTTVLII